MVAPSLLRGLPAFLAHRVRTIKRGRPALAGWFEPSLFARGRVAVQEASVRAKRRRAVVSARAVASEAERDAKQEEVKSGVSELREPAHEPNCLRFVSPPCYTGLIILHGAQTLSPAQETADPPSSPRLSLCGGLDRALEYFSLV